MTSLSLSHVYVVAVTVVQPRPASLAFCLLLHHEQSHTRYFVRQAVNVVPATPGKYIVTAAHVLTGSDLNETTVS